MGYLDNTGLEHLWAKIKERLSAKQDALVSGTNIKTVNGNSLLGSGDITTPTYTLPTASTSTLGGVKVDGSTITIADGVISSSGGGGGGVSMTIGYGTIAVASWSLDTTSGIYIAPVTLSSISLAQSSVVFVSPVAEASLDGSDVEWANRCVRCAGGSGDLLQFYANSQPTRGIMFQVVVLD